MSFKEKYIFGTIRSLDLDPALYALTCIHSFSTRDLKHIFLGKDSIVFFLKKLNDKYYFMSGSTIIHLRHDAFIDFIKKS